jgi:hypothetical protein
MKKFPVYITHNQFSYANPSAISTSSNEVVFDMNMLSEELKAKVFGQIGIVELTRDEMIEISDARITVRIVGAKMFENIFKKVTKKVGSH